MRRMLLSVIAAVAVICVIDPAMASLVQDEPEEDSGEAEPEDEDETEDEGSGQPTESETETEDEGSGQPAESETETETEDEGSGQPAETEEEAKPESAPLILTPTMTAMEIETKSRQHRIASIVLTGAGGGALVASGVLRGVLDPPEGPIVVGITHTAGSALLFPGTVSLIGNLIVESMAAKTGRTKDDLWRWKSGLYRACYGGGLIIAGSVVQYLPLVLDGTDMAGFHIAGVAFAAAGAVMMAEGYSSAEKGLWYARPAYGLSFVVSASLIIPKLIHAALVFSPAGWAPEHGFEDLGWIGAGVAISVVEMIATHPSRSKSRKPGTAQASSARSTTVPMALPWLSGTSGDQTAGLLVVGSW